MIKMWSVAAFLKPLSKNNENMTSKRCHLAAPESGFSVYPLPWRTMWHLKSSKALETGAPDLKSHNFQPQMVSKLCKDPLKQAQETQEKCPWVCALQRLIETWDAWQRAKSRRCTKWYYTKTKETRRTILLCRMPDQKITRFSRSGGIPLSYISFPPHILLNQPTVTTPYRRDWCPQNANSL